ncbi:MAG: hypothetical protein WC879_14820 [Melioribacteraceae bacterium]
MRTLIYVPIIHTGADLGSLAQLVMKRGIADLGEDIWKEHQRTVERLWDVISDYFASIDVSGMKIYQDGMIAEGELGEKIVEECVKAGSRNYELIAKLLKRGATLIKSEDFNLVKEERDRLFKITQAKTKLEKLFGFIRYKLTKNTLLNKRDKFIALRIDESLPEDQTGILFIGAYHNIRPKLHRDIQIKEIKYVQKVKEYQLLLPFYYKDRQRFEKLSGYLTSEIEKV